MPLLTPEYIATLTAPAMVCDSEARGLYLRLRGGSVAWQARYKRHRKTHFIGLGSYPTVNIEEAKARIRLIRSDLVVGEDPRLRTIGSGPRLSADVWDADRVDARPRLYTLDGACAAYGLSKPEIIHLWRAKEIRAIRSPDAQLLFFASSLDRWVERQADADTESAA